jgi:hypothetical protein
LVTIPIRSTSTVRTVFRMLKLIRSYKLNLLLRSGRWKYRLDGNSRLVLDVSYWLSSSWFSTATSLFHRNKEEWAANKGLP